MSQQPVFSIRRRIRGTGAVAVVSWAIRPLLSLTGPVELRVRVLPKRSDSGEWAQLGRLELVDRAWCVV